MARAVTDEDDPFAIFHAPPLNETHEARIAREAKEAEEKRVSDQIDEQLAVDRVVFKKQKNIVRILLLGQAESGKSTTLKHLRMTCARDAWNAERPSWRSVIQWNLVRSIITIVDILQAEMAENCPEPDSLIPNGRSLTISPKSASTFIPTTDIVPLQSVTRALSSLLNHKHQLLQLRLEPLRRVETDLKSLVSQQNTQRSDSSHGRTTTINNDIDEVTEVIASCKDDMVALWSDPANDIERIASRSYEPSDDDVLRAYLRTLGVQEYKTEFTPANANQDMSSGSLSSIEYGREWRIYDVGGPRTTRHAWLPYFENVQAIIFLAPVLCFDQWLSESSKVNRLEDSFMLWQTICESKLLAKAGIILLLNKIDLLQRKLRSGVKIKNIFLVMGKGAMMQGL